MTTVQAKRSSVMKYTLDSYSFSPMDPEATPMTSAATPDFQLMPRATEQAENKKGFRWGR